MQKPQTTPTGRKSHGHFGDDLLDFTGACVVLAVMDAERTCEPVLLCDGVIVALCDRVGVTDEVGVVVGVIVPVIVRVAVGVPVDVALAVGVWLGVVDGVEFTDGVIDGVTLGVTVGVVVEVLVAVAVALRARSLKFVTVTSANEAALTPLPECVEPPFNAAYPVLPLCVQV